VDTLLSLLAWFELGALAVGGFFLQLALLPVTLPWDKKRWVLGRLFRRVGVSVAGLSPFWRFETYGPIPKKIPGRTVVVANHESDADPFLISHLPWEMKWLGKEALFKIPIVGWSMRLAGDIPVRRGDPDSARKAMATCREWLERGVPVMLFPEGTRSETGELLPFKDGAFRLAIEAGADILPIAVSGTRKALPKHSWRFQKATARVAVGDPIPTRGMSLDSLDALKDQARAQISALRSKLAATLSDSPSAPGATELV
jgi:1-acyl-sn-glycerol-3-phosphate acyltransferase